jgi:Helix-turn-helix domain
MPAIASSAEQSTCLQLEPLLKIEDAAKIVGRTHWTLRADIKAGKLRCVRIGRRIMIEPAELQRLIEASRR